MQTLELLDLEEFSEFEIKGNKNKKDHLTSHKCHRQCFLQGNLDTSPPSEVPGSVGVDKHSILVAGYTIKRHQHRNNSHHSTIQGCYLLLPIPRSTLCGVNYAAGLAAVMASKGQSKLGSVLTPRCTWRIGKWLQHCLSRHLWCRHIKQTEKHNEMNQTPLGPSKWRD